jgi:hypothetical protein
MTQINKQEQWLINGKCELCRKQKYCGTKCNKALQRIEEEKNRVMQEFMNKLLPYQKILLGMETKSWML